MAGYIKASATASKAAQKDVKQGVPFFKPKTALEEGKYARNYIRILPPRDDYADKTNRDPSEVPFYHWQMAHYFNKRPYLCSDFHHSRICEMCDYSLNLRRQGKGVAADDCRAQPTALVNMVEVDKNGALVPDAYVKVFQMPKGVLDKLINEIDDAELPDEEQDITDPEYGRTIIIKKHGEGMKGTKYEVVLGSAAVDFNGGDYSLLERMHDLTELCTDPGEEMIGQLVSGKNPALPSGEDPFAGTDDDDEDVIDAPFTVVDDEDDEPAPAPKAEAKQSKTKRAVDAEDDAAAAKARLRAALAAGDDDDDED